MNRSRLLVLLLVLALAGAFFSLHADRWLSLDTLRNRYVELDAWVNGHFLIAALAFVAGYAGLTAVNLPVAAVLTLAGGTVFGLWWGTLLSSIASSVGATLAFLLSRFLFRDYVERRFPGALVRVNEGLRRDGAYYLFALRLVPVFPFFVINVVMGLTRIPVATFHWIGQLGMLPGTFLYTNAGTRLGELAGTARIVSPALLASLVLLGIFPLLARRLGDALGERRRTRRFRRPPRYEANVVVIGGGSAGLVSAYVAAAARARVVLIEAERMGGECLHRGCVPSKALLRSARLAAQMRRAGEFGFAGVEVRPEFAAIMARVRQVIARIEPHDSVERYRALGVECISGRAVLQSPFEVAVGGRTITTRAIIIATGGRPALPPVPGLAQVDYLNSDTVWDLDALPGRLVVLGGGATGCELAQAFRRLGSEVTLVEALPRLLAREDADVSAALRAQFEQEGIRILCDARATNVSAGSLELAHDGTTLRLAYDRLLVATGRRANTAGFGLEELGVALNDDGTIRVNEHLQATYANVYACGDVAGPWQLTNAAAHQGWYCAMNALFGTLWRQRIGYDALPRAVYTDPEVARIGLSAGEARDKGLKVDVTRYDLAELDRAIADGNATGWVEVLTRPGSDRILGATIVGPAAGELIGEFTLAMRHGLGLRKLLAALRPYPTLAEANRFVAGAWQRDHLSPGLLRLADRFHGWRRGS